MSTSIPVTSKAREVDKGPLSRGFRVTDSPPLLTLSSPWIGPGGLYQALWQSNTFSVELRNGLLSAAKEGRPCSEGPASPRGVRSREEWEMGCSSGRGPSAVGWGTPAFGSQRASSTFLPLLAQPPPITSLSLPPFLPPFKHFFSLYPSSFSGLCLLLPASFFLAGKASKGGAVPRVAC